MGNLITLGIYAAIAAAAWFAFHSWTGGIRKEGADAQLKLDVPVLNACKVDRDSARDARDLAVNANRSLQGDITRIAAERDLQSKAVQELQDAMAAAEKQKLARQAAARPKIDALRVETGTLEQRLALNTEGKTCDEKLSNVDRDLRAIVGGVVRDATPAAPNRDGGKDTAPGARAGKGTLRLSQ